MLRDPPSKQPVVGQKGVVTTIWQKWFGAVASGLGQMAEDGSFQPVTLADADAENNAIYYSSTASKLVYKDSGGSVHALY